MSYERGAVVLVRFPNADLESFKRRPALIVQADDLVTELQNHLVALITSSLEREGPSRIPFMAGSSEWVQMGLKTDSVVVADNIATVPTVAIDRRLGSCPEMAKVDAALRHALGL